MLNKVCLIGHVGADPEVHALSSGNGSVAQFNLATSERWRDKATGERKEKTEWHRIVIFNENLIKVAEQYVRKGSKLYVEGALQTRKWQDKSGNDRWSTEVVLKFNGQLTLLDKKGDGPGSAPPPDEGSYGTQKTAKTDEEKREEVARELDDEIPF